ncbi:hypothetical protein M527_07040 [Sphingobium indicum IP26]|uniref:Phage gp6-like head-tail connector protein n=1 Tax=Sphingobium indicum F2 TaxID=1450518 RepID=A0A8E1C2X8_9SPHN|nr:MULTISPECIES: hypothetical protein [Sphingobium]EPR09876.1 hypothetical protein M527_07040 [Sphingobium indicum IP26]EQB05004.1 hypothetical protein L286_09555 [Sphingobium sp. HDIP04]KER36669.1 hypothetical protein AL00_09345 [Sphingobium indicum F2]
MLSAPIVITPPTADVIDLEEVKLFLRYDGTELDGEIADHVRAAVAEIERTTATRLADQVVEVRCDRFADLSHLQVGPVSAIVSIAYEDPGGVATTLAADAYELVGAGLEMGVRPAFGYSWPATRAAAGVIAVRLQVGYAADALPATLKLALKMLVRSKFDGTPFDLFEATVNDRIWL